MKHHRLLLALLAVPIVATGLVAARPAGPAPSQSDPAFVREFAATYLHSIAQRREVQDRDLTDARGWARAILGGADEKQD